jgi:hypothetical protein
MTITPEQKEIFRRVGSFEDEYVDLVLTMQAIKEARIVCGIRDNRGGKKKSKKGGRKKNKSRKTGGGILSRIWKNEGIRVNKFSDRTGLYKRLRGREYEKTSNVIKKYIPDLSSRLNNVFQSLNPKAFTRLFADLLSKLPENVDPRIEAEMGKALQDPDNPDIPPPVIKDLNEILEKRTIGGKPSKIKSRKYVGGEFVIATSVGILFFFLMLSYIIHKLLCKKKFKCVMYLIPGEEAQCISFCWFMFRVLCFLAAAGVAIAFVYVFWYYILAAVGVVVGGALTIASAAGDGGEVNFGIRDGFNAGLRSLRDNFSSIENNNNSNDNNSSSSDFDESLLDDAVLAPVNGNVGSTKNKDNRRKEYVPPEYNDDFSRR